MYPTGAAASLSTQIYPSGIVAENAVNAAAVGAVVVTLDLSLAANSSATCSSI
jgi:hypothetical protein